MPDMTTRIYLGAVPGRVRFADRNVRVTPGETIDVSDDEAKQLDAAPDEWAEPKSKSKSKRGKSAPTEGDEPEHQEPTP